MVSVGLLKALRKENLTVNELFLLIYFYNLDNKVFNINNIVEDLGFDEQEALISFNSLITKNLISLQNIKDENKKIKEIISLDELYRRESGLVNETIQLSEKESIYEKFEKEFARTLSPMEYEIINAWLERGMKEETVILALKEATYNGVCNLRYIDKILAEWTKKGVKKPSDIKKPSDDKESKDYKLFDYNWLEENENRNN